MQGSDQPAPAAAARLEPAADPRVEDETAAAIGELIRHQGHGGDRVEARVEPGAVAERCRRQPAGVNQAQHVSILVEAELVAHWAAHAGARSPVDAADVVVGGVLADRLELGTEPEWPEGAQARVSEPAATHREREAPGVRQVRIDVKLGLLAGRRVAGYEAEPTLGAAAEGREPVAAAGDRQELGIEAARTLVGFDREPSGNRLTDLQGRSRCVGGDPKRRAHSAAESPGDVAAQHRVRDRAGVVDRGRQQRQSREDRDRGGQHQRRARHERQQRCGSGGRAQPHGGLS
ncbi:MAG: hypothetical protein U0R24_14795 [Solirubrobacterales bacterium]